jgi:WD repeat-containing protein 19
VSATFACACRAAHEKGSPPLIVFHTLRPSVPLLTPPRLRVLLHFRSAPQAREASKDYAEAAKAYERARDTDNLVRLLLDHLDAPERAAAIVRQTRSSEGATLLARYCVGAGDFRGGIEFLLLARKRDDAFALASAHGEMALYVQALKMALAATASGLDLAAVLASATAGIEGSGGDAAAAAAAATEAALAGVTLPADECNRIAAWYEGKGQLPAAAAMYAEAEAYGKALKLYLQCGEACIDAAISVVGRARSDAVTHALIDYLMGESDGVPKDPRYIFKLYVALGNFPQAAKTALIIARQEQQLGNYKVAHDVLWETYRDLVQHSVRVPQDLLRGLTLLHSYLLVKRLVKLENHDAAAAMMVRVAAAVSQFPQHVVPILTSTVIECQRAGLKRSAYEYACQLVRPEYRDRVEPKFAKKIEALVRRPSTEEADQGVAPCPFCDRQVPTYQLNCDACKATIPFCIVSGRHMTLEDCSSCTHCKFPALFSSLAAYLTVEPACPMCSTAIMPASIGLVSDPLPFLRRAAAVTGERIAGDAEGDGAAGEEKESESGASASNGVAAAAALAGKPAAGAGKPAP